MSLDSHFRSSEQSYVSEVVEFSTFLRRALTARREMDKTADTLIRKDQITKSLASISSLSENAAEQLLKEIDMADFRCPDVEYDFASDSCSSRRPLPHGGLRTLVLLDQLNRRRSDPQYKSIALRTLKYDMVDMSHLIIDSSNMLPRMRDTEVKLEMDTDFVPPELTGTSQARLFSGEQGQTRFNKQLRNASQEKPPMDYTMHSGGDGFFVRPQLELNKTDPVFDVTRCGEPNNNTDFIPNAEFAMNHNGTGSAPNGPFFNPYEDQDVAVAGSVTSRNTLRSDGDDSDNDSDMSLMDLDSGKRATTTGVSQAVHHLTSTSSEDCGAGTENSVATNIPMDHDQSMNTGFVTPGIENPYQDVLMPMSQFFVAPTAENAQGQMTGYQIITNQVVSPADVDPNQQLHMYTANVQPPNQDMAPDSTASNIYWNVPNFDQLPNPNPMYHQAIGTTWSPFLQNNFALYAQSVQIQAPSGEPSIRRTLSDLLSDVARDSESPYGTNQDAPASQLTVTADVPGVHIGLAIPDSSNAICDQISQNQYTAMDGMSVGAAVPDEYVPQPVMKLPGSHGDGMQLEAMENQVEDRDGNDKEQDADVPAHTETAKSASTIVSASNLTEDPVKAEPDSDAAHAVESTSLHTARVNSSAFMASCSSECVPRDDNNQKPHLDPNANAADFAQSCVKLEVPDNDDYPNLSPMVDTINGMLAIDDKSTDLIVCLNVFVGYPRPLEYHEIRLGRLLKPTHTLRLLGSQTLADLRNAFTCPSDYTFDEDFSEKKPKKSDLSKCKYPSSYFFIHDTFYIDESSPYSYDMAELIRIHFEGTPQVAAQMQMKGMNACRLVDLRCRLGQPYVFVHQGSCEHLLVFNELHLRDEMSKAQVEDFPLILYEKTFKQVLCAGCRMAKAERCVQALDNPPKPGDKPFQLFESPCFLCNICYREFCFRRVPTAPGQPIQYYKQFPFRSMPFIDRKAVERTGRFLAHLEFDDETTEDTQQTQHLAASVKREVEEEGGAPAPKLQKL